VDAFLTSEDPGAEYDSHVFDMFDEGYWVTPDTEPRRVVSPHLG